MQPIISDDIGYWIIWIHGKPVENTSPTHSYLTANEKGKDIPETYQNYQYPYSNKWFYYFISQFLIN